MALDPNKMKQSGKQYTAPRKLIIDPGVRNRLIGEMAEAFREVGRKHDNEVIEDYTLYARNVLRDCTQCTRSDGTTPWLNAPCKGNDMEVLASRLKVKGYDMIAMEVDTTKSRAKKKKNEKLLEHLPKESDRNSGRIKYGTSLAQVLSEEEFKQYNGFLRKLKLDFPKLDTVSDVMGLEILAILRIRISRITIEMSKDTTSVITKDAAELSKLYKETTVTLGISGQQRARAMEDIGSGTIADLAKRYHNSLQVLADEEHERYIQELHLYLNKFDRKEIEEAEVLRHTDVTIPRIRELLAKYKIEVNTDDFV